MGASTQSIILERYYTSFAAQWARYILSLHEEKNDEVVIATALAKGHDLHMFKRLDLLRVHKVISMLRGLNPESLLDLGFGKGLFLWPLMETFPDLIVTGVDSNPSHIIRFNQAVDSLNPGNRVAYHNHIEDIDMSNHIGHADVVTLLEVLEHVKNPQIIINRVISKSNGWVIVTVPSKPDDNPEHLHYFKSGEVERMLIKAGAKSVKEEHILNHRIVLARVTEKFYGYKNL